MKATNFNANIDDNNTFESFKYKTKLLGNTEAYGVNVILRNTNIAVPLKCISDFWRLLEVFLINCKVELKLMLTNHSVLSANGNDNDDTNSNNSIFTINDSKLNVPVTTLSAKDNRELWKLLSKGFERSVHWNEYKTKNKNKNTANNYRYFWDSKFVGVKKLFVLAYSNQDENAKRYKVRRCYLQKSIIKNYNVIISGKNFYDQSIDSDIKRYEEIRKLTSGQNEYYTTACLLDYD